MKKNRFTKKDNWIARGIAVLLLVAIVMVIFIWIKEQVGL